MEKLEAEPLILIGLASRANHLYTWKVSGKSTCIAGENRNAKCLGVCANEEIG